MFDWKSMLTVVSADLLRLDYRVSAAAVTYFIFDVYIYIYIYINLCIYEPTVLKSAFSGQIGLSLRVF